MNSSMWLFGAAALFSAGLAVAVIVGRPRSIARWSFAAGMLLFAAESICGALSISDTLADVRRWQLATLLVKSLLPAVWLVFGVTYSRGDYRESLVRARSVLIVACLVPLGAILALRPGSVEVLLADDGSGFGFVHFEMIARVLNALLLIGTVLVLMNLERTFRSAVGTMQWRIKFLTLGLAVIFGRGFTPVPRRCSSPALILVRSNSKRARFLLVACSWRWDTSGAASPKLMSIRRERSSTPLSPSCWSADTCLWWECWRRLLRAAATRGISG